LIKVCHVDDLPDRSSKVIMVKEIPVAVINAGGKIFAWDNRCPHRGASLADGHITDTTVQCKFHLWEFDIKKECAVANEAIQLRSFHVIIENDEVFLEI